MKRLLVGALAAMLAGATLPQGAAAAQTLFWAESTGIRQSGPIGTAAADVVAGWPDGVAINASGTRLYWTDNPPFGSPLPGRIRWSSLDGTQGDFLVSSLGYPLGIALEPPGMLPVVPKMFWADGGGDIRRANIDGSNPEILVKGLTSPYGVALDPLARKVYWTRNAVAPGTVAIGRANFDGSGAEGLVKNLDGQTTGIALDVDAGKMYWGYVDPYIDSIRPGLIMRADLDGSDAETVVSGLVYPAGVALDTGAGFLYWTDTGFGLTGGSVGRAYLDGSGVETLLTGLSSPRGLAILAPEPATLALAAAGGLGLLMRRQRGRLTHPA
ncbi:MAG: hypothetical protein IMZ66_12985 [Planctomycetes bacterium]|nr:hypothetical protein [Planctomycetota bacterium]